MAGRHDMKQLIITSIALISLLPVTSSGTSSTTLASSARRPSDTAPQAALIAACWIHYICCWIQQM